MSLLGRRRPSPTTWYLQRHEDGTVDVLKRGRPVMTHAPISKARSFLRSHMHKGDRAYSVEPDGYRTPLLTA